MLIHTYKLYNSTHGIMPKIIDSVRTRARAHTHTLVSWHS